MAVSGHDAVLFDLDGVLVDSRIAFARSVNAALRAHDLPERAEADLHRFIGPPLNATFAELGAGEMVASCVAAYRARYLEASASETTVVPGMPDVLAHLSDRVPLAVATSKTQMLADPLLDSLNLRRYFIAVVGPGLAVESESKAETIGRALTHFSPGSDPVMIGDRSYDVAGALAHGLPCVGVLWGIGSEAELAEAGADQLARDPGELPGLIGV